MLLYKSLYDYGEAEYVIEKSRFIAHAMPVASLDEAKEYVASVKEEYRDATHNVPAIIVGAKQEVQWASDDGEPGGTSGLPMLKLIAGEGLTNLAVVVTRYFGGIKLGTGGLARAYTASAKLGLEAAGVCDVMESALIRYEFDYSYLSKLQNMAGSGMGTGAGQGKFEIIDP
ncbi:MAG: YigZ family protein, partial [Mogibacterium sp.]|nr:YigZ family protein [Mogibacterium sp.]